MGFFDDLVFPDQPLGPEEQHTHSARNGPPVGSVLPTLLPWVRVLGQSQNARIALVGLRCWPECVSLELQLMCRWAHPARAPRIGTELNRPDWEFRFGVQFSDGRRGMVPGDLLGAPKEPEDPDRVVLLQPHGGGGGRFHRQCTFHLWPLPPQGFLTLVVDWPFHSIPETRTELDAAEIRSAANRAIVVWPDLPDGTATADKPGRATRVPGDSPRPGGQRGRTH